MKIIKSRKGYIAPLAMALIVVFVFILVASFVPEVKTTAIQIVKAFTGG